MLHGFKRSTTGVGSGARLVRIFRVSEWLKEVNRSFYLGGRVGRRHIWGNVGGILHTHDENGVQ
jgi:hypothetical protein